MNTTKRLVDKLMAMEASTADKGLLDVSSVDLAEAYRLAREVNRGSDKFSRDNEVFVAINTFATFYRFDLANGVYANSPLMQDFDGSATGYWERRAHYFGTSDEELAQIKRDIAAEVKEERHKELQKHNAKANGGAL